MSHAAAEKAEEFRLDITPSEHVTVRAYRAAPDAHADVNLILAHGAGGNQTSSFMVRFATALAVRGIQTLTFNFVYSEERRRVPDRNDKLENCYRTVLDAACAGKFDMDGHRRKLVIGGKSMGGRIASQVAAAGHDGVTGLVFLGYPLHPPGRPDKLRSKHLPDIRVPMLFVQGSRDAFGTPDELRPIIGQLKGLADLCVVEDGDHSFKVAKRSGRWQDQVYDFVLDEIIRWLRRNFD
ncbi:MAG TPA: alpha/beta family hydrolase [Xanthobacteraceae bacterium]|nr:alpha/beta family hydrolase [Xanthobacteraceae bacterium]